MKNKKHHLWLLSALVITLVIWIHAQVPEFNDSNFDGAWAGSLQMATASGKQNFPLVANLNCQGKSGMGYVLLSHDLTHEPSGVELFKLVNIVCKGKKLTMEAETSGQEVFKHKFILKYKGAKGILSGKFTSTDPGLKKGKISLHPQSDAKISQKVWQGSLRINNVKTPVFLQLIQKDALGNAADPDVTSITGFGFIGEDHGPIAEGSFNGNKITGNLVLAQETVILALNIKGLKMNGTFSGVTFSGKTTLKPAGSKAKSLKLQSASPTELTQGESNAVTINGNNFEPGVLIHVDHPGVEVEDVVRVSNKKLMAYLIPSETAASDQGISLLVTGLNGQSRELSDAFTLKPKEQPVTVSFSADIQPVFNQNCAVSGCHTGGSPPAGLNLSSGAAYGNIFLINSTQMPSLQLINPFDPDNSYLIRKIKGQGISGGRMPFGRTPLGLDIIAKFENWVLEGALDN